MSGKPLKVLLVYDCVYPESLGGVEHRNHELAAALGARGHEVTIAGWTGSTLSPAPGVLREALRFRTSLYNAAGKRRATASLRFAAACLFVDLRGYDVIETANIAYLHMFVLASRCRRLRIPLVISWYEYWGSLWRDYVGALKAPVFRLLERASVPLGVVAAPISTLTAQRLLGSGRSRDSLRPLPGGVPCHRIREAANRAPGPGPPLIYAGRLHREKRLDLAIRAVAQLELDNESTMLSIVGDGPDRARLERLVAELGAQRRVSFLGRLEGSTEVWQALGGARIAVQPSMREGFGLFPLEAMAAGLPVVYCESAESAVGELVEHEVQGLRSSADPAALALRLASLLDDDEKLDRMSANARLRAEQFDWDAVCDRFEEILFEAANREPIGSRPGGMTDGSGLEREPGPDGGRA